MTRTLRSLGVAIGAAVRNERGDWRPAAQAQTGVLTTQQYPSIVTGEQQGGATFDIGEPPFRNVTCGTSDLDATLLRPDRSGDIQADIRQLRLGPGR